MADGLRSPAEIASRLRNQARKAARELQAWERAVEYVEQFGVVRVAPNQQVDERALLEFVRRARQEHPAQELQITVLAR